MKTFFAAFASVLLVGSMAFAAGERNEALEREDDAVVEPIAEPLGTDNEGIVGRNNKVLDDGAEVETEREGILNRETEVEVEEE